jgi:predicted nucleic acid-binding protein
MRRIVQARIDERTARGAADAILRNVEEGIFTIPFRLTAATPLVRTLLKKYAKVPMDFADACLVTLAEALGTGRILTLDGDFHVYRWRKARRFEILGPLG